MFKEEKRVIEPEKIKISEINNWIKKEEKNISLSKQKLEISIKENISKFIIDLNEKIALLECVSIEHVKEEPRTKHLVELNFNEYTNHLESLLSRLEDYEKLKFDDLNASINKAFNEFNKKSHLNYQRATYLIGKELGDINDCINKFLLKYSKNIKENEHIIQRPSLLNYLRDLLKEKENISKTLTDLDSETKNIYSLTKKFKEKIIEEEKTSERTKQSKSYSDNLKRIKQQRELDSNILKEVSNLKQLIDFKYLFSIFRHNNKELEIVKKFKENFYENLKNDNGQTLLNFLSEAKINTGNISKKIEIINEKQNELADLKLEIKSDETKEYKENIKNLILEIDKNKEELEKILRRKEKSENEKKLNQNNINNTFEKLNLTLL